MAQHVIYASATFSATVQRPMLNNVIAAKKYLADKAADLPAMPDGVTGILDVTRSNAVLQFALTATTQQVEPKALEAFLDAVMSGSTRTSEWKQLANENTPITVVVAADSQDECADSPEFASFDFDLELLSRLAGAFDLVQSCAFSSITLDGEGTWGDSDFMQTWKPQNTRYEVSYHGVVTAIATAKHSGVEYAANLGNIDDLKVALQTHFTQDPLYLGDDETQVMLQELCEVNA